MAYRAWTGRIASLAAALAVAGGLGGCSLAKSIKFTNVSDTWLNVDYYVGAKDAPEEEGLTPMYWKRTVQVKPGETARYAPPGLLVHMQVETVAPSWEPPARQYWLELLTRPPVHIVATGRGDKLDFKSGSGEVAIIPERELSGSRYEYRKKPPPKDAPELPPTEPVPADMEPVPADQELVGPAAAP